MYYLSQLSFLKKKIFDRVICQCLFLLLFTLVFSLYSLNGWFLLFSVFFERWNGASSPFFLNKLSNFVLPLEWDITTASLMSPFIYLLRDMSGHHGRTTITGKSHNKRSNTYLSTRGSESVLKKVKTSNKTIQFFFNLHSKR